MRRTITTAAAVILITLTAASCGGSTSTHSNTGGPDTSAPETVDCGTHESLPGPILDAAKTAALPAGASILTVQALDSVDIPGSTEAVVRVCAPTDTPIVDLAYPIAKAVDATGEPVSVLVVSAWSSNQDQNATARSERFDLVDWANTVNAGSTTPWTITAR